MKLAGERERGERRTGLVSGEQKGRADASGGGGEKDPRKKRGRVESTRQDAGTKTGRKKDPQIGGTRAPKAQIAVT